MKKILILLLIVLLNTGIGFSKEFLEGNLTEDILFKGIPVRVTAMNKVSTSKRSMQVGNDVDFVTTRDLLVNDEVVIKKNTKVRGKVLDIVPNKAIGIPAKIVLGNFETSDVFGEIVPLKGEIKKEGNPHNTLISYLNLLSVFVRGGEVQIIPEEDYFILFY
jgi:hypothetical protein